MFTSKYPLIVISEPDLLAALQHLRSLPYRPSTPIAWDRQYVLGLVREAMPGKAKVGDLFQIGPGLYGIVQPFGVDLAGGPIAEGRLQIWIAIRSAGTDPDNICEI